MTPSQLKFFTEKQEPFFFTSKTMRFFGVCFEMGHSAGCLCGGEQQTTTREGFTMSVNYKMKCMLFRMGMSEDWIDDSMKTLLSLRRLAKKHHRLAEMDCNGEGVIRGVHYYNGTIDDYARREYGQGVQSAYIKDDAKERTVFDVEDDKLRLKIEKLCKIIGLTVEFQGDPRGYTCKFYDETKRFLDIQG